MPTKTKPAPAEPKTEKPPVSPMFTASRRVLLAAVGAIALAQDEIEEFVHRLVERGGIAEKEGKNLVEEIYARRRTTRDKIRKEAGKRVGSALEHFNIPSKKDIEQLNEKIAILTQKIEELKKDA